MVIYLRCLAFLWVYGYFVSAYLTLHDHHYSIIAPNVIGALLSIFGDNAAVYGGALFLGLLGVLCLAIPIDALIRQMRRPR
jgi:hypothetical protein